MSKLSLNFVRIKKNMEQYEDIAVLDEDVRYSEIFQTLELDFASSANNPATENARKYVGSGCWSAHRSNAGTVIISIDVGCACSHDCCGCMCGLTYEIVRTDSHVLLIKTQKYNY